MITFDVNNGELSGRASYAVKIEGDVIALEDYNQGRSLTNDAAQVVADLVKRGYDVDSYRIMYRDSAGRWDGIATARGAFASFFPLNATDFDEALATLQARA